MEVAGFTIGAVALISLFKDCVDLFSMITAARDLGRDAAILNTKLDVEKMLFLQWSDRVGLLKQGSIDTLFSEPESRQVVSSVLGSIKQLLSEGSRLRKGYGMAEGNPEEPADPGTTGASAFRLARFLKQFEALKIQDRQAQNLGHSSKFKVTAKRIRWVIDDKKKFDSLINDRSCFNSSLNNLIATAPEAGLHSSEKDLVHVRSSTELKNIIKASGEIRPDIKRAAIAAQLALRILHSLWYRWYDDRRINIKNLHFKTLKWALDPPKDHLNWDDLNSWLQTASGIYWLSGKAGSGKSTLMKYLHEHERTHDLLRTWADGSELILAGFFFYALGRPEQKSQSGLLRSLLYQILYYDPSVTKDVLPHVWREASYKTEENLENLEPPSVAEMTSALRDLCSTIHADKKLFFLIDGIDEYEGKDLDVAKFISDLGSFPNVKILVSSRPHPAFVTAFSQGPKMSLQDLTKHDVVSYVIDTVTSHPYMVTMSRLKPQEVDKITQKLVHNASGVFLWLVLACRSVIEGCDDFSTISDLNARVGELPKEVEDLIHYMLERIDPRWKQEAMKLIHLVYTNEGCQGVDPVPTFGLYSTYEHGLGADTSLSGINLDRVPLDIMETQYNVMEGRLRSRCGGLLEVQYDSRLDENI
ncbi:hypothetical protein IL306_007285 [Fusarium sp. DS 682]|nr:hypothetical protein IL306_007285 [Fusarium sp. DS 682]